MSEFAKTKAGVDASEKKTLGEGLFRKCEACGDAVKKEDFARNHEVCPACGAHFHLPAEDWIALLADDGSWSAQDTDLVAADPLAFVDTKAYPDRVEAARQNTGVNDAILAGEASIDGRPVQLGVFVFRFMGGSMGAVVGEVVTRLMERGAAKRQPVTAMAVRTQVRSNSNVSLGKVDSLYIKYKLPGLLGLVSKAYRVRGGRVSVSVGHAQGVWWVSALHYKHRSTRVVSRSLTSALNRQGSLRS